MAESMRDAVAHGPLALRERVLGWVQKCRRTDDRAASCVFSEVATEPTIISLCLAILTAELYDAAGWLEQPNWAESILADQDPVTGLFIDPAFSRVDLESTAPGADYLHYQTTYFALNALDALGTGPRHALHFVEPFRDASYLWTWLENLDWTAPWKESNWIMFIATALYAVWQWEGDGPAFAALHHLLDWLDDRQDPKTGFWGVDSGAPLVDAMAGAYHFLPFYLCLQRPIHFPEQLIDSTLSLQQPDGLFHPSGGGDACLDVDAADILVKASLSTMHRAREVHQALKRVHAGLLDNLSSEGGFCRARQRPLPPKSWKRRWVEAFGLEVILGRPYVPPQEIWYYSGWKKMPFDIRQADLWSTWFRSYGLALIDLNYGEASVEVNWRFRRLPALGWHSAPDIVQDALERDRPVTREA
jgi:hypothetical protein